MKSTFKYVVFLFVVLLVLCIPTNKLGTNEQEEYMIEYTEEYLEWLNIPKEQRINIKTPRRIEIENNELIDTNLVQKVRSYASVIPSSYDLRSYIRLRIRDQETTDSCWAFAVLGVLETNLQLTKNVDVDLSERHMDYATSNSFTTTNVMGFNRQVKDGGDDKDAYAYLTNGMGAILEDDMPLSTSFGVKDISYIQGNQVVTKVEDYVYFPAITKNTSSSEKTEIMNQVKQHIMKYGAVKASVYRKAMWEGSDYFNGKYAATYYDGSKAIDHDVIIIGWDDNFSKTKFNSKHRPKSDGAWIIKNSWGTSYGEKGYFYVSYEDECIGKDMSGIQNSIYGKDYDNLYQYNPLGENNAVAGTADKMYAANIFKKNTKEIEKLTEVSINLNKNTYCKVYVNPKDSSKSIDNLVLATKEYKLCSAGYHTIKLDTPLAITGDEFVVIVEQYVPNGVASVCLECTDNDWYSTARSNYGESFYAFSLTNDDNWIDASIKYNADTTIKAFSKNDSSLDVLSIGNSSFSTTPIYNESIGKIVIPVTTKYVANDAKLKVIIKKDNIDVTNKFTIDGNNVINNLANIEIQTSKGISSGKYQVEISYGNLAKKDTSFQIEEYVHVSNIELSETSIKLKKSQTKNLDVIVTPQNAFNKNVIITNSNPEVASINENGQITALSRGTTTINVTSQDGNKVASCIVTVTDPQVNYEKMIYISEATNTQKGNITIPVNSIDIENNTELKITVKLSNKDVTNKFEISGNLIKNDKANINIIIPIDVAIGNYEIEIYEPITGKKYAVNFEIRQIQLKINKVVQSERIIYDEVGGDVFLNIDTKGIKSGEEIQVQIFNNNIDVTNKFEILSNIVEDNKANIQIHMDKIEKGQYEIKASFWDQSAVKEKFVVEEYVHVESVNINKSNIELKKGDKTCIDITISPANAINKNIIIKNSDPSVIEINEKGEITGLKRGTTTITAVSEDRNKIKECIVTVVEPSIQVEGILYNDKVVNKKRGNIIIQAKGIDIKDNTKLDIEIMHNKQYVTDKFNIVGDKVVNNLSNIVIEIPNNIEIGIYNIIIKFENKIIYNSEIKVNDITAELGKVELSEKILYEDIGGKITIPIVSNNIEEGEIINVYIVHEEKDVTKQFNIIGNKLENGMTNIEIEIDKGIKAGKYKIIMSYGSFINQEYNFIIEENIHVEKIYLNYEEVRLNVGESLNLIYNILPESALNKNILINNSNSEIVYINKDNTIIAKKVGEAIITFISEDGNKQASCKVIVEENQNANKKEDKEENEEENKQIIDINNNSIQLENNVSQKEDILQLKNQKDNTTANKELPKTGENSIMFVVILVLSSITILTIFYYRKIK